MITLTTFEAALRAYEAAHEEWINTAVWGAEAERARAALDTARTVYVTARDEWKAQHLTPAQHSAFPKGRWS